MVISLCLLILSSLYIHSSALLSSRAKVAALDYTSLLISVNELSKSGSFVPSLVENVQQLDDHNIALGLKGLSSRYPTWLQVCWHPIRARVCVGHPPPRTEPNSYSFSATLRSLLKGLTLTRIDMGDGTERIVELFFSKRIYEEPMYKLVTEVMGSRSNVILVEVVTETILAVAYQVGSASSKRPLQTGGLYLPPPAGSGVYDPSTILNEPGVVQRHLCELWEAVDRQRGGKKEQEQETAVHAPGPPQGQGQGRPGGSKGGKGRKGGVITANTPLSAVLVGLYRGMSPNIAQAVSEAASEDSEVTLASAIDNEEVLQRVEHSLSHWAATIVELTSSPSTSGSRRAPVMTASGGFCPVFSAEPAPEEQGASTTPSLDFFRDYYESHRLEEEFYRVASDCRKKLEARDARADQLMFKFRQAILDSSEENVQEAHSLGDLITAYLYNWQHAPSGVIGREEALECFDFVTGEPVLVTIPATTSPADHASSLYRKAKKLRRSRDILKDLLDKIQLHKDYLEELTAALESVVEALPSGRGSNSYAHLSVELPLLLEIREEVLELEEKPLVEESSALYRDEDRMVLHEEVEDWAGPAGGVRLKGKEKYLAHRQRVQDKKSRQVKASEARKKGLARDKGKAIGTKGKGRGDGKKGKALSGLTVLAPHDNELAGAVLVVGRSSKQNDRISFQVAKEHHVWFHADGVPGSHCLLLLQPGEVATDAALQFGADVAAWHSKARGNSDAPVTYTSPRHLKKITGGGPGMVSVMKIGGVLRGRPDRGEKYMAEHLASSQQSL